MDGENDLTTWYMQQVVIWQPRLYAFVLSLTGNPNDADEVLQNANLALITKQDSYRPEADFGAWAMQNARFEVQRFRASNARARKRFDDILMDQLLAKAEESSDKPSNEPSLELKLLRWCMSRLSASVREMLVLRYSANTVQTIAEKWGRTEGSISQTLCRARIKLGECIRRALKAERRNEP